jgi:hypothetical protein
MTSDEKLFELFHPVAQMEAAKICKEFGRKYLRLYEEDDLINWAFLSDDWKRYVDNPGAMRQVIRFSMLRQLAKAQDFSRSVNITHMDLSHGVPYKVAQASGLIDKNLPYNPHLSEPERGVQMWELRNPKAEDPLKKILFHEMMEIIHNNNYFTEKDRDILLRRLREEETFDVIAEKENLSRAAVRVRFIKSMAKLRRLVGYEAVE